MRVSISKVEKFITVDITAVEKAFAEAARQCVDTLDMWEDIGEHMMQSIQKNFDDEGRPEKWDKLHSDYEAARPAGKILTVSSDLRNSISPKASSKDVIIGTNKEYAAIHQFGDKTKAHTIKPRYKKFLKFTSGGETIFSKGVSHPGSKVPARPFLLIQTEDEAEIVDIIEEHIGGHF
jgi:phage virion morphogenesis protein